MCKSNDTNTNEILDYERFLHHTNGIVFLFSDSSRDRFHNSIQYTDKQANRLSTRGGYSPNEMPILETNQSPKDSGQNVENDSTEKAN